MLVKINTSLASKHFDLPFGTEMDSEEFSALVGNGWQSLCDPIEIADARPPIETADLRQSLRRGRQR